MTTQGYKKAAKKAANTAGTILVLVVLGLLFSAENSERTRKYNQRKNFVKDVKDSMKKNGLVGNARVEIHYS